MQIRKESSESDWMQIKKERSESDWMQIRNSELQPTVRYSGGVTAFYSTYEGQQSFW
jgi:hypothetical protein